MVFYLIIQKYRKKTEITQLSIVLIQNLQFFIQIRVSTR